MGLGNRAYPRRGERVQDDDVLQEDAGGVDERTVAMLDQRGTKAIIRHRGWLVRRMLLLADMAGLLVAFFLTDVILDGRVQREANLNTELGIFVAALAGWVVVGKLAGLYDHDEERADHSTVDELARVVEILTVGIWTAQLAALVTGFATLDVKRLAVFWALGVALVVTGRAAARAACRRSEMYDQNTAIVGTGEVGQLLAYKIQRHPEYGINLVGFVDKTPRELRPDLEPLPILGPPEQLPALVRLLEIERVVIAFSDDSPAEMVQLIRSMNDLDVQIDIIPRFFEIVGASATIHSVEGLPLIGLPPFNLSRSSQLLKRGMDILLAGTGLIVLLPLFLLISLLIKLDSRGPVFFRQVRMGSQERTFRIHKFRTMVTDAEERKRDLVHLNMYAATMFKVPEDPRVTRVGRFLRRYSLDELPQLLDVLQGRMSLVGPRPLILDEDQHVVDWARRRLNLRPGMTGLWQVLGRNSIPFEDMTKLDYLYVANWSPWGDLRLILQTIPTLFRTRRAY
jgi:exopolysaccharide biosynthesis polyprenyl glycosylphosphotransferase